MKRTLTAAALATAVALGGVACSSSSNESSSSSTSTTTTTAANAKSFEVSTQDGQVSLSLDGKLPPGWPSSFPLPDGATPAGSGSLGGSSSTVMVAAFTTSGTPEDAYTFYTGQSDLTIDSQSSVGSGERYIGTVSFSGSESGRVTVLPKDGETLILVVLQTSGSTSGTTPGTATPGSTPGTTEAA